MDERQDIPSTSPSAAPNLVERNRTYFCNWHWENKLRKMMAHGKDSRDRIRRDLSSVRGHAGERPVRPWFIVCELVDGSTDVAIGKKLSRDFSTIAYDARKLGFSGRRCKHDLGDPFVATSVQQLKEATDLSASQLAKDVGLPAKTVADLLRHRNGARRIDPRIGQAFIEWRDKLTRRLLASVSKPSLDREKRSGSSVLKTLFPSLGEKRKSLGEVLTWCRHFLREHPGGGVVELQDHLCELAARGVPLFVRFLPWAPELMPFLKTNLDRVREPGPLWRLADEAIASCWGATPNVVNGVAKSKFGIIPPEEMRRLIGARVAEPHGKGGAPKKDKANFVVFNGIVQPRVKRFRDGFANLAKAKKENSSSSQYWADQLTEAGFSGQEVSAILASRNAETAAIRWAASNQSLSFKTGKNYYSQAKAKSSNVPKN